MNNLKVFLLLLLFITACTTNKQQANVEYKNISYNVAPKINNAPTVPLEPYAILFQIEESDSKELNLVVSLRLFGGSHFVSPNSSDRFSGRFNISITDNDHLVLDDDFKETPRSVEIYDPHPFVKGLVNWVSVSTNYKHLLHIKTQEDFEVRGLVSFTIEPRCTFEKVPFIIKYADGEISVELDQR